MLLSLSLVLFAGMLAGYIFEKIGIPKIIGMLLVGIILGPYVFDVMDPKILSISQELRSIALIIILLRAGMSLDFGDLRKVGRPAFLLSFLPASFEIAAYTIFAPMILGISTIDAAVMGAVLGAVSPAVVVPKMVSLMEEGYGVDKGIPQMILAGSSMDDVFVIVLFFTFTEAALGNGLTLSNLLEIPVSIISGIAVGAVVGYFLYRVFEKRFASGNLVRNSKKLIVILAVAFFMKAMQDRFSSIIPFSGLLAVIAMAMVLGAYVVPSVKLRLFDKTGKLWIAAEIMLFVLVGSAVDVSYTLHSGVNVILMIFTALAIRSIGVSIALLGTDLNSKERLFTVIAYLPKATVQAAIGSVPAAMGLGCGDIVLSVAVMGILITAPLGAWGMEVLYRRLLVKTSI